jgi:hypothetical protein
VRGTRAGESLALGVLMHACTPRGLLPLPPPLLVWWGFPGATFRAPCRCPPPLPVHGDGLGGASPLRAANRVCGLAVPVHDTACLGCARMRYPATTKSAWSTSCHHCPTRCSTFCPGDTCGPVSWRPLPCWRRRYGHAAVSEHCARLVHARTHVPLIPTTSRCRAWGLVVVVGEGGGWGWGAERASAMWLRYHPCRLRSIKRPLCLQRCALFALASKCSPKPQTPV